MFSVIIPLYNKEPYLAFCIKSVLDQTFSEFEVIVVNDGSTDNSILILKQFDDPRIGIIEQSNLGVSAARNNGVRHAQYEFIAFLDADDWWDICFLERMSFLISDFPEASIFGSQYFWVKNKSHTASVNYEPEGFRGYMNYFKAYTCAWWMPLSSISVVVRKDIFLHLGGFNTRLQFGEDVDLWLRFALEYKLGYINEPLAYYNQDIDKDNRAIGGHRLYPPSNHFIFNLSYLKSFERNSSDLKQLLDGLRVRSLLPYFLSRQYVIEVKSILREVDFKQQPLFYRVVYRSPVSMVRIYFGCKKLGSIIKQSILRSLR